MKQDLDTLNSKSKMEYSKEQIVDIQEREKKGLEALKALDLTPAASTQMINIGNDTFAVKLIPYLQDTKYTPQKSPVKV